ncbi:MAG: hypothetical protein E7Z87_07365 [Cyanobacteria bacterium SIG26]|nr:hypothetical protein [Cyanobacteria bacterium SIG26]
MKKIIPIFVISLILNLPNFAFSIEGNSFLFTTQNTVYKEPLAPQGLEFQMPYSLYQYDSKNLVARYVGLDKKAEKMYLKSAPDNDEKTYKNIKKAQKDIAKNKWVNAEEKMPNFIPIKLQYFDYLLKQQDIAGALRILVEIKDLNKKTPIIEATDINYNLAVLFFATGQYGQALNYYKMFESVNDDTIFRSIAECYYNLNSYQQSLNSLKSIKILSYADKELFFLCNYKLKNFTEANKYALILAKETPNYTNYMRVATTSSNQDIKLNYLYKARNSSSENEAIMATNSQIAKIEQDKLNKKVNSVLKNQFIKIPNWNDVLEQLPQGVQISDVLVEQDKFFKNANIYITKYKGQQLTNAFNSLSQDCNNFIQNKKNEFYQMQQLQAQNALVIEQQRQNQLQQQMIYEQQRQNAIQHQQLYYMRHRYYYY